MKDASLLAVDLAKVPEVLFTLRSTEAVLRETFSDKVDSEGVPGAALEESDGAERGKIVRRERKSKRTADNPER